MAFPLGQGARKRATSPARARLLQGTSGLRRLVRGGRSFLQRRRGKGFGSSAVLLAVLLATLWVLFVLRVPAASLTPSALSPLRGAPSVPAVVPAPAAATALFGGMHVNISAAARALVADFDVPPLLTRALPLPAATELLSKLALARMSGIPNPRLFVIHAQNGLGNRLRALASGLAVARRTRRVPLVVWEADAHLGARFGDILSAAAPAAASGDVAAALYDDLVVVDTFPPWEAISLPTRNWRPFNYMVKDGPAARQGERLYFQVPPPCPTRTGPLARFRAPLCTPKVAIKPVQHVYFKSAYVASTYPGGLSSPGAVNAEIRRLRPVPEVLEIVKAYYPAHVRYVYGAHVRSRLIETDGVAVNGACEYTASAEEMTDFWRSRSQMSEFLNILHYLLRKYHQLHFFVAADDAALLQRAERKFPGRIHYIPRNCDDRNPECVRYALADLLCLARTARLYGSNWSSFTEAAGRLANRRPLLSGVHFGQGKGKDQNYRNRFVRGLRTARVRLLRALSGWRTHCPKKR